MDDKRIIGLTVNEDYARWAHKETDPDDVSRKPEALDDMLVTGCQLRKLCRFVCLIYLG